MSGTGDANAPTGRGFLGAAFESFRQSLSTLVRVRLLWVFLAGEGIAAVVAYGIAGHDRNRLDGYDLFCLLAWWGLTWLAAPWSAMYLAIHTVYGEIEDRTVQYVFLRPVRRVPVLLGKWLAAATVAAVTLACGVTVLFLAVGAQPGRWALGVDAAPLHAFLVLAVCGAVAYSAVGVASAAAFGRPLVVAAGYVVLQMVAAILPVSAGVRMITVSDPLRRLLVAMIEPGSELENILWPGDRAMRSEVTGSPLTAIAVWVVVLLAFALLRYSRAEYDARERE